jgi:site-specific DNA recombinase
MHDISLGKVDLVMVSELSRLSRSIRDFCHIWELMRERNCSFLSLREQFDTTTAAGELMLFNIVNFAQFERRQVSERVFANFTVRAERGLYNGGTVPFGYELNPDDKGVLRVNPDHAKTVNQVFRMFLNEESLSATARLLNSKGYRRPKFGRGPGSRDLGVFTSANVYNILTNKAYIGIRVYKGEELGPTAWPAIVESEIFARVGEILKKNYRKNKKSMKKRFPFLVSGILFCGSCGNPLSGSTANGNGGKFVYYEHSWKRRLNSVTKEAIRPCSGRQRFQGNILEPLIWNELERLILRESRARQLLAKAQKSYQSLDKERELDQLRVETLSCDEQLERLAAHLAEIPAGVSAKPIFSQMEKLERRKGELKAQAGELEAAGTQREMPVSLSDYRSFLASLEPILQDLTPELKAEIVKQLVHRIDVSEDGIVIHFYAGSKTISEKSKQYQSFVRRAQAEMKKASGASGPAPEASQFSTQTLLQDGSGTVKYGGPGGTRTPKSSRYERAAVTI